MNGVKYPTSLTDGVQHGLITQVEWHLSQGRGLQWDYADLVAGRRGMGSLLRGSGRGLTAVEANNGQYKYEEHHNKALVHALVWARRD